MIAKNELEKTDRKLPILMLHPKIFLEDLRETTRNISKKSRFSVRDSKVGSLENEAIIRYTCLVILVTYCPAFPFYIT
jgi:hypothetical protein